MPTCPSPTHSMLAFPPLAIPLPCLQMSKCCADWEEGYRPGDMVDGDVKVVEPRHANDRLGDGPGERVVVHVKDEQARHQTNGRGDGPAQRAAVQVTGGRGGGGGMGDG